MTQSYNQRPERTLHRQVSVIYRNVYGYTSVGTAVRQGCGDQGYYYVLTDDTIVYQKDVIRQRQNKEE